MTSAMQSILHWEVILFLGALAAIFAYRMLTGQMRLRRILCDPSSREDVVSPERVQLLIVTLVIAGRYITWMAHNQTNALPNVSGVWLSGIGASGGIYGVVKGLRTWAASRA